MKQVLALDVWRPNQTQKEGEICNYWKKTHQMHANVAQLPLVKNVRLKNEKRTTVRYIFVISN